MARYKVTKKSFINGRIVRPGEVIEYDGEPGDTLVPAPAAEPAPKAKRRGAAPAGKTEDTPNPTPVRTPDEVGKPTPELRGERPAVKK